MTLSDFANISQIVQAVLVVISLGFIWYQLRESIRLARAANAQSLTEQALSFNSLLIEHEDVAALWYSYGENFDTPNNMYRYREMLVQWLILHENIYYQWRRGLLDDEIYNSWLADLKYTVKRHSIAVIAPNLKEFFCGEFGDHMIQLVSEKKNGSAPPKGV